MSRERIDDIVKAKQRDVAIVSFQDPEWDSMIRAIQALICPYDKNKKRIDFINWLNENEIPYGECDYFSSDKEITNYYGDLYIDLVMDINDEKFLSVCKYLENPDGTSKIDGVFFMHVRLEDAMSSVRLTA